MLETRLNLYQIRNFLMSGKTIYDLPLRVTYYARVSTDKYEQLNSLDNQIAYYSELIKNNSNWTYIEGYIDEGISGTSTKKRDNFMRMIKDAYNHKFDLILTKEISRFSRNTLDSIRYTEELLGNGIGVFFECDNINTFMPDSELRLTIMASMAQEEVRKLSERVKFGFQRSIKNGRVLGNNAIWGYRKDNGKLIIIPEEAEIVKKIFSMYVHNRLGMLAISKELTKQGYKNRKNHPFSSTSIKGILTNPKYKGYYCGNKTRIVDYRLKTIVSIQKKDWVYYKDEDNVPSIVSEELWDEAQKILQNKSSNINLNKKIFTNRYPFSGKIICKEHNAKYRRKINISNGVQKKKKIIWVCSEYIKHGIAKCNGPQLDEKELKKIVGQVVTRYINGKTKIVTDLLSEYEKNYSPYKLKEEIENRNKAIINLNEKNDVLIELRINKQITDREFNQKKKLYHQEINKHKEELKRIMMELKKTILSRNNENMLKDIALKELEFVDDNIDEMLYILLDKIYVSKIEEARDKANLEIYLNIPHNNGLIENVHYFCIDYTYDKSRC